MPHGTRLTPPRPPVNGWSWRRAFRIPPRSAGRSFRRRRNTTSRAFASFRRLSNQAQANLKKALDLFDEVSKESEPGSPQARAAAFGAARTQEARGELTKAIKLYEQIAKNPAWAETEEARSADRLARVLKTPEAEAFYKQLYAYKPPTASLPPGGMGKFDIPLPAGHPPVGGPLSAPFSIPGLPGEPSPFSIPAPPPSADPTKPVAPATTTIPDDPFTPSPKDAPKPEAPKPE